MTPKRPLISGLMIVVLNWNEPVRTIRCVESLLASDLRPEQVLVVDNNSQDDSVERLHDRFPDLPLLTLQKNYGFAGGMNRGVAQAIRHGAESVMIVNNDTIAMPGMVPSLLDSLGPMVALSPEIRYLAKPEAVWFGRGVVDRDTGLPRHATVSELNEWDRRHPNSTVRPWEVLAGCCSLAEAETWKRVGPLTEDYFLIFEESEWSTRVLSSRGSLGVVRESLLKHEVSASFGGPGRYLSAYYYARNGWWFLRETARPRQRVRFLLDSQLRPLAGQLMAHDLSEALWAFTFGLLGISAALFGQGGSAPSHIGRLAERAAQTPTSGPRA